MSTSEVSNTPKKKKNDISVKILIVGLVIILAYIASLLVFQQVKQRENLFEENKYSIAEQWGSEQTIKGPYLVAPYQRSETVGEETRMVTDFVYILPNDLELSGDVAPNERSRGIYDVVVYDAQIMTKGSFTLSPEVMNTLPSNTQLTKARLVVNLDDTRGIKELFSLQWNENDISFEPGAYGQLFYDSKGVSAPVRLAAGGVYDFSFPLTLQGTERISFSPFGSNTKADVTSSWPSPSFTGAFLPEDREISDDGFSASWVVSSFGRSYPQVFTSVDSHELLETAFGVELFDGVNFYSKTSRAVKYAILFIVMTVLVFFLFEVLRKTKIHFVQYLLVGIALALFYLLLLSLGEHIGFLAAYIVAAIATIGLIAWYASSIFQRKKYALFLALFLTFLYVYLYILLQLENFSLLVGSLFLFVVLGVVMQVTRKIDWYSM